MGRGQKPVQPAQARVELRGSWQTFGMIDALLLVMVAHTIREEDQAETVVRIISARRADRKERRFYEDENG